MTGNDLHIAWLRGINVGGKNKLPMKELAALFTAAGCAAVQTYIQSGNVVFRAPAPLARRLPARISQAITNHFGLTVPVVTRTADELRAVVGANPFLTAGIDPSWLHVAFLAQTPSPAQVAALDPNRSPPDRFAVRAREVFLRLPNGVARTRLTNAYLDSVLKTTSTLRNWNTILKMIELVNHLDVAGARGVARSSPRRSRHAPPRGASSPKRASSS